MEIFINTLNQLTPDLLLYGGIAIGILVLLLVYRIVIAPKLRHRKVLAKVRQMKYKKEIKKMRDHENDDTYTWGTFTRSEASTAYEVKEFNPEMNTQFNKIMNDLSEEEITNIG